MTTICIHIGMKRTYCCCSGKVRIEVSGPGIVKHKGVDTGFKYATQTINEVSISELKFLIPSATNGNRCNQIKLCKNGNGDCTQEETIKYKNGHSKVYVYFYKTDPRPLLVCYNGKAYIPKDKASYDREWVQVENVKNCVCNNGENGQKEALLNALTKVVGFLNEVRLDKGPGTCSTSPGTPSTTCTGTNGQSCTYDVHEFQGNKVQIKVECCPVKLTPPGNGLSCYKKLIHTPAGLDGKPGTGFRLGDVTYNGSSGSRNGSIDYYGGSTSGGATVSETNKYKPLVKVIAYFYNEDKEYKDPLLVELEFAKNGGESSGAGPKEYYKLQPSGGSNGLEWEKDEAAKTAVGNNGAQLVKHLDKIRYEIKKVLKIELHQQAPYKAHWSTQPGQTSGFTPVRANGDSSSTGNKQIQVEDCNNGKCTQLTGYKCFQHKITSLSPEDLNKIGGIALTLPSKNGAPENPVEIKLHDGDGGCQNGGSDQIPQLFYNKCMGDVYVFFYDKGGTGTDTVPLMVFYNCKYYKPNSRDDYFTKWVCVNNLGEQASQGPCGGDNGTQLAGELDKVNRALNVIDLYDTKTGKGTSASYGLPTGTQLAPEVGNERVKVTKQQGPKQPTNVYTRVVHRTKNGFEIGDIKYSGQDITEYGVNLGPGASIKIKNNGTGGGGGQNGDNHKSSVTKYNWNTVVAYYSNTDREKKLPQLIVILKTDEEVKGDGTPVTGARGIQYGYYILSTKERRNEYEYVWRTDTGAVTLNDSTDFSLLNSIVVLIDKNSTGNYSESQISGPIKTAKLKSPGRRDNDINRFKYKTITVSDESHDTTCSQYGYKLFKHQLSLSTSSKLGNVDLIAGLRFLIHTKDKGDNYNELKLCKDPSTGDSQSGSDHYLYYNRVSQNVYVYFYGETDPRPLLVCYNSKAYKPKSCKEYDLKWVNDKTIQKCGCSGGKNDQLLPVLTQVVGFLNKVQLQKRPGGRGD